MWFLGLVARRQSSGASNHSCSIQRRSSVFCSLRQRTSDPTIDLTPPPADPEISALIHKRFVSDFEWILRASFSNRSVQESKRTSGKSPEWKMNHFLIIQLMPRLSLIISALALCLFDVLLHVVNNSPVTYWCSDAPIFLFFYYHRYWFTACKSNDLNHRLAFPPPSALYLIELKHRTVRRRRRSAPADEWQRGRWLTRCNVCAAWSTELFFNVTNVSILCSPS